MQKLKIYKMTKNNDINFIKIYQLFILFLLININRNFSISILIKYIQLDQAMINFNIQLEMLKI